MKNVSLCVRRPVCLGICALCLGCSNQDTVDKNAAAKPATPVVLDEQSTNKNTDAKSASHEGKQSALAKAKDLLREADKSGGVAKWLEDKLQHAGDSGQDSVAGSLDWANSTFELLKTKGLTTAGSVQEWVLEEYSSMGTWEYKVVKMLPDDSDDQTEAKLNELGSERWECFNVVRQEPPQSHYLYYFKREKKSYLKSLPLKDMLRLLRLTGSDGNSN